MDAGGWRRARLTAHNALANPFFYMAPCLLPFGLLVYMAIRYGYDFPFLDQWALLVPVLDNVFEGRPSFSDIWEPANGHRLFFPYVIMVALARLTHWNHNYEIALNVVLGTGAFLVMARQVHETAKTIDAPLFHWLIPATSLFALSMVQWEGWLFGWHIVIFTVNFSVVIGILLLSTNGSSWRRVLAAVVFGMVASYSHATGLAYWPTGLFVLLCSRKAGNKGQYVQIGIWLLATFVVAAQFLYDALAASLSSPSESVKGDMMAYPMYAMTYLGASLMNARFPAVMYVGTLGLLCWCVAVFCLVRLYRMSMTTLAPHMAYGLFGLGCAVLTSLARAQTQGVEQATSSRYASSSLYFWISLLALLSLLLMVRRQPTSRGQSRQLILRVISAFFILVMAEVECRTMIGSSRYAIVRYETYEAAAQELYRLQDDDLLRRLYPEPEFLKTQVQILKKHRLSIFREGYAQETPGPVSP